MVSKFKEIEILVDTDDLDDIKHMGSTVVQISDGELLADAIVRFATDNDTDGWATFRVRNISMLNGVKRYLCEAVMVVEF